MDGVGGATSTTSKVAVVAKSKRPDADVDYTFAQVAVGSRKVDFSGNCGNIASGVGPFALDEGLVSAKLGQKEVTATQKAIAHGIANESYRSKFVFSTRIQRDYLSKPFK
ncbi:MAG: hypothetical protein Q9214_007552 [Letrouitia sp. 1 TL-2023]